MPKVARDVMSPDVECVSENDSLLDAARKLASMGVGALPICGEDDRLKGMLSDRDIVVKALAQGKDPSSTRAGELAEGPLVTVEADYSLADVLNTMAIHRMRRLPVIDGGELVGTIAIADLLGEDLDPEEPGDAMWAIVGDS